MFLRKARLSLRIPGDAIGFPFLSSHTKCSTTLSSVLSGRICGIVERALEWKTGQPYTSWLLHLENEQVRIAKLKNININDEISLYTCYIELFSQKNETTHLPVSHSEDLHPHFSTSDPTLTSGRIHKTQLLLMQVYAGWHKLSSQYCLAIPYHPYYVHISHYLTSFSRFICPIHSLFMLLSK